MTKDEQWLLEEKYHGKETAEYEADKADLVSGKPLPYVIGWQPFLGLRIYLDSHPLIPRPETEWWTERLLEHIKDRESAESFSVVRLGQAARSATENDPANSQPPMQFLDLCSGSGAIGCAALAKLPNARIYFGDIDPAHEATIRKNIRENALDASRAEIRTGDFFTPFAGEQFDIIASNPPYIPATRTLPAEVIEHEPPHALFSGADGLDSIRRIAEELGTYLAQDGVAWIECDSTHATTACALFTSRGFHAEVRTDQYGRPRILVVTFPKP